MTPRNTGIQRAAADSTNRQVVEDLRELVRALDRRLPHLERSGESDIVREAAALRAAALERIQRLERSGS